jgi:hypothetical protein
MASIDKVGGQNRITQWRCLGNPENRICLVECRFQRISKDDASTGFYKNYADVWFFKQVHIDGNPRGKKKLGKDFRGRRPEGSVVGVWMLTYD